MDNCNVKIGYTSGIICGINNGTIENMRTYGEVEATSTSAGVSSIGAVCGKNGKNGKCTAFCSSWKIYDRPESGIDIVRRKI